MSLSLNQGLCYYSLHGSIIVNIIDSITKCIIKNKNIFSLLLSTLPIGALKLQEWHVVFVIKSCSNDVLFFSTAKSYGVLPFESLTVLLAPLCINLFIILVLSKLIYSYLTLQPNVMEYSPLYPEYLI